MTRIVAGSVGGRRIEVPSQGTRPTSDRVREALFSALESLIELPGAWVLDLYAGSGALGFEALSRGAAHALFVEHERRAVGLLRRNAAALGFTDLRIEQARVETSVSAGAAQPYDVVLMDPPYALDEHRLNAVIEELGTKGWTSSGSVLVVERAVRSDAPHWPDGWEALRIRRYGDTALHWALRE